MTSRLLGTGASLLFMISALFSKTLLKSPTEANDKPFEMQVANEKIADPQAADLSFLASTSDRVTIKLDDFKSEETSAKVDLSELVSELSPTRKNVEASSAGFVRSSLLREPIDANEKLFSDMPADSGKSKSKDQASKAEKSTEKQSKSSQNVRRAESVESSDGSGVLATANSSMAGGVSSGMGSGISSSSGRSFGTAGGYASGLGSGARSGGGSGNSSGSSGGSFPSFGGGGGGGGGGSTQGSVASSVGQSSGTLTGNTSQAGSGTSATLASNKSSVVSTSTRPQLTADGKYGIPNHQYWTFDFKDNNGDGLVNKADADKEFNDYLFGSGPNSLTNLLKAANQVVSYSPTELSTIYSSLNSQVPQDKSPSYVTFMIIDFPVKGFYLPSASIPSNPSLPAGGIE